MALLNLLDAVRCIPGPRVGLRYCAVSILPGLENSNEADEARERFQCFLRQSCTISSTMTSCLEETIRKNTTSQELCAMQQVGIASRQSSTFTVGVDAESLPRSSCRWPHDLDGLPERSGAGLFRGAVQFCILRGLHDPVGFLKAVGSSTAHPVVLSIVVALAWTVA